MHSEIVAAAVVPRSSSRLITSGRAKTPGPGGRGEDRPRWAKMGQGKKTETLPRSSKGGAAERVNSLESLPECKHEPCPWISQTRKANAQMKALSSYFDFCS